MSSPISLLFKKCRLVKSKSGRKRCQKKSGVKRVSKCKRGVRKSAKVVPKPCKSKVGRKCHKRGRNGCKRSSRK